MAPLGSLINIRILEYNTWALAAALERDVLEVVGRGLHDGPAGVGAAGKGNLVHIHVPSEGLAGDRAYTRDDVDDAWGETSLDHEVAEVEGGKRCLLGRLENNGVSASKCRCNFPG